MGRLGERRLQLPHAHELRPVALLAVLEGALLRAAEEGHRGIGDHDRGVAQEVGVGERVKDADVGVAAHRYDGGDAELAQG